MAHRVGISTLNASSIDIINTIRQNASAEYQSLVPEVTDATVIPKVGEVLYGYPALANQFLTALINRIALVRVKSATFNNRFAPLKKGYLDFGMTVEETFVQIAKAREFSAEKAAGRELARTIPDVRTAFHAMNWRVQYPVTIQDEDLRQAFLSIDGVTDLISRIVDSVYRGAEYDEYLLFKYVLIKAASHGKMYPVTFDASVATNAAKAFRGISNTLTFLKTDYNESGVHTNTDKNDQYIFMDSNYNAEFDVDVLSAAFNMDKAEFMGHLILVDDWTTFDNDRFEEIRTNCYMIDEVTAGELSAMENVKAILVDQEFFQFYDNQAKFTEKYVSSGEYWNYNYNVWKTVSTAPFSNAVVFLDDGATVTPPASVTVTVSAIDKNADSMVFTLALPDTVQFKASPWNFVQTQQNVKDMVAVHPYGAYIVPVAKTSLVTLDIDGKQYTNSTTSLSATTAVGATIALTPGE